MWVALLLLPLLALPAYSGSCSLIDPAEARNASVFLTIQARDDGLGAIIARIVPAVAFALRLGWQFAGVVGKDGDNYVAHHIKEMAFLSFYFGKGELLYERRYLEAALHVTHGGWPSPPFSKMVTKPQDFDSLEHRVQQHFANVSSSSSSSSSSSANGSRLVVHFAHDDFFHETFVLVNESSASAAMRHVAFNRSVKDYVDDFFLKRLRNSASCGIARVLQESGNFFLSSPPWVNINEVKPSKLQASRGKVMLAVHIRLGDVVRGSKYLSDIIHFTPLSWYYHVLLGLEQLLPNADIHVFTSFDEHYPEVSRVAMRALGTLRLMGYKVHASNESSANHLATREAMRDVAHMATADVVLTARSSFSVVAAYLNPNCVLYLPFQHPPLEGWILLPPDNYNHVGAMRVIAEQLPPCLQSKGILLA